MNKREKAQRMKRREAGKTAYRDRVNHASDDQWDAVEIVDNSKETDHEVAPEITRYCALRN